MLVLARTRRVTRRGKKFWVAALCVASCACGYCLFGDDSPPAAESLLSQYLKSTKQVVDEVQTPATIQPPAPIQPATPAKTEVHPSPIRSAFVPPKPETPAIKAAPKRGEFSETARFAATENSPIANDSPEQQLRRRISSRRVKPADEPAKSTSIAKSDKPTDSTLAAAPAIAPVETKPQASVTYVDVPQASPSTAENKPNSASQPLIIENKQFSNPPFVVANPMPIEPQKRIVVQANVSPNSPSQVISVGRQSAAVPLNAQVVSPASAVGEDNLPPIVSPDSVPRPGMRKRPATPSPPTAPVLRIELGQK